MKNVFKSFAVLASILSFAACQKEIENPIEKTRQTHTVTFVAGNPETKTAAIIDEEKGVVDYVWKDTDADEEKFHVFENGEAALSITPSLNDGKMSITAKFEGEPSGTAIYTGYFNSGVQAVQNASGTDYDQLSDVLIAKETTENNDGVIPFQFKRLGAVCEVNLKGLVGTNLKTVKIEALDENVFLAGSLVEGELVGDSKVITINCDNAIIDGVGTLRFISMPIENANLRFIVETTDGSGVLKYERKLGKSITFTRGDLKTFNVSNFSQVTTTVTFSENKVAGEGIYTAEGEDIPFPEVENVDANNVFVGWTKNEEYSAETKPTDLCTEAKMGAESVIYYAVYASISPATINPDEIVKLDASSTFAAGDNIAVFAKADDVYYGMYQETVSTSYVNYFTLNQEPVATDFKDAKKSWTLSAAEDEGKWYLGDATNGYLYNSSNNLYAKTEGGKSSLTIAWNENKEAFYIKNGDRWIACRADLTGDNQYKYRGGGNSGSPTSGSLAFFDIYKLLKYNGYNTYIDLRPIPTLTWSEGSAEARLDGDNSFPTLTTEPAGLTVSYSSSNTSAATINNAGDISLVGEGTTTITATFEGNAQYKPTEASYTLTVLPAASKHTVQFSINGSIDNTKTKEYTSGETIEFPANPVVAGASFRGWLTSAINGTVNPAPTGLITDTDNIKMGDADVTYYAVFATESGSSGWKKLSISEVTAAGVYAILTTDGHAFNGIISSGHGQVTTDAFSFTNGEAASAPTGTCELTFTASSGGYKMYCKDKGYLYAIAASSGKLAWHETETSYWSNSSSNWTYASNSAYLRSYNNASIRTYGANNGDVLSFAKKVDGTSYSDYCTTFRLLQSISVSDQPTKTEYYKGESFDPAGLSITLTYSAGEPEVVTYNSETQGRFSFDPVNFTEAGQKTITITYASKTTTCNVNVKTIANTKETAYSVAQAKTLIDAGKDLTTEVYVKGIVSQVDSYNSTYNSITYWISDNGTTTDQFEVYSGKNLNNTNFSSKDDVEVGANVIIYGLITKFNSTYEFALNNYLVFYKAKDKPIADFVKISEVDTEVNKELDITDYLNIPDNYTGGTISVSVKPGESNNVTISGTKVTFTAGGDYTLTATASAVDGICAETFGDITFSVKNATLQSVSFGGSLTKTTYTVGENFDRTGITLMANYSDESSVDVTDQAEWMVDPEVLNVAGDNIEVGVYASFGGKDTDVVPYYVTVNKKTSSISIEDISIEIGQSKTITPKTLTPSSASLTYEIISGNDCFTIAGNEITGTSEGAATVKASFAGNDTYSEISTTFTVTVTPVSAGETKTYQHVFSAKPDTGNNIALSGVNWNISATNLGAYNSGNYAGVQIGSKSNNGQITLTSPSSWSFTADGKTGTKITEVRLWLNLGGTSVTPKVTIGGKEASKNGIVTKNSSAGKDWTKASKVTFTPVTNGNTGEIVIEVTTEKAGYICALEIDTEDCK